MENRITPEAIVNATAKSMKESAEITYATLRPLAVPFLRAFALGLDMVIRNFDSLKPLHSVTGALKYKAWEEEYKKHNFMSSRV